MADVSEPRPPAPKGTRYDENGVLVPKMAYEKPMVEDLGDLADTTLGEGGFATGDVSGSMA